MKRLLWIMLVFIMTAPVHGAMKPIVDKAESFSVTALSVLPGGAEIAAAFSDGSIRLFDASSGLQKGAAVYMRGIIRSMDVTGDGKKLFIASDKLYLMELATGQYTEVTGSGTGLVPVVVAADSAGYFGAGAAGSLLNYYNLTSGRHTRTVRVGGDVTALAVDTLTQTVYTASSDGNIKSFSMASGTQTGGVNPQLGRITSLALGGDILIAGGDKGAAVLQRDLSGEIRNLSRHTDTVRSVSITLDGRFAVTGGDDASSAVWDLASGSTDSITTGTDAPILALAVDPYFRYLLIAEGALGDKDGIMYIQYTSNKNQQRRIYAFRDATLTLDKMGYAGGVGPFGKYLSYDTGKRTVGFSEAANVVNKPEKLRYDMPRPRVAAVASAPAPKAGVVPQDTTPPVISTNERGFAPVSEDEIVVIEGSITDDTQVAWGRVDGKPLILAPDGSFRIETTVPSSGKIIVISAADIYGNTAEKVINLNSAEKKVEKTSSKIALLIGINNYLNLPALRTPEYDTRTVGEVLRTRYGYEPVILLGASATRDAVLSEVNRLRRTMGADDSLIVYYAGHGYADDKSGNAYWQLYDSHQDDDTRWLLTSQLTSNLASSGIGQVLVISDSCFSGAMAAQAGSEGAIKAIISSGGNEPVADLGQDGHSVFSGALIEELKHQPVDASALFDGTVIRIPAEANQTPQYKKFSGGEFRFDK